MELITQALALLPTREWGSFYVLSHSAFALLYFALAHLSITAFDPAIDLAVCKALDRAEVHGGLIDELGRIGILDGLGIDIHCLSPETAERLDDYLG